MRSTPRFFIWLAVPLAAVALAACGSAGSPGPAASTTTTTSTVPTAPSSGGTTSTTAATAFFTQSGTGTKDTRTFTAKGRWDLSYTYSCDALGHHGNFTLVLRPAHGAAVKVTSQKGLGGGGTRPYGAGTYSLSVTTPCQWTVNGKAA